MGEQVLVRQPTVLALDNTGCRNSAGTVGEVARPTRVTMIGPIVVPDLLTTLIVIVVKDIKHPQRNIIIVMVGRLRSENMEMAILECCDT